MNDDPVIRISVPQAEPAPTAAPAKNASRPTKDTSSFSTDAPLA